MKRYALISNARTGKEVAAYLPDNYKITNDETGLYFDGEIFVEGEDVAGWTLDAYVIPRLASGNLVAKEMYVWNEDTGNGESGPSISSWLNDEPQTAEAMQRYALEAEKYCGEIN